MMRWIFCGWLALSPLCVQACDLPPSEKVAAVLQFDLPAQPLGDSLRAIGFQTSSNVLFEPEMVQGQSAPPFKAQATFAQALCAVLKGSGLKLYFINEHTATLVRKAKAVSAMKKVDRRS